MLPTTTSMLLAALGDSSDDSTWEEFDGRYRGVLIGFAQRLGLSAEDAREVTQEALTAFVDEYRRGRYDRERGRLRSWLFAITRSRVLRRRHEAAKQREWRGTSAIGELPGADDLGELWEREWRAGLLLEGLRLLKKSTSMGADTLRAFEGLALEERDGAELALELGMTENAVYQAKFRVMQRLREILVRLEGEE